jgi:hypothetical protein
MPGEGSLGPLDDPHRLYLDHRTLVRIQRDVKMTSGMGGKFDAHARTASFVRIENVEAGTMTTCNLFDDSQA